MVYLVEQGRRNVDTKHSQVGRHQGLKLQLAQGAEGNMKKLEELFISAPPAALRDIGANGHRRPTHLRSQAESLPVGKVGGYPIHATGELSGACRDLKIGR